MEDLSWKNLKLALERPYKDDNGDEIPVLFDISPDGQHIYEPKRNSTSAQGEKLRRIFMERGFDFFEKQKGAPLEERELVSGELEQTNDISDPTKSEGNPTTKIMSTEELFNMRMEILPQLFISLGEMSHARDLLTSLLSSQSPPLASQPSSLCNLSATVVSKPAAISSVQAFNSQLTIGSKDEALRKAANVFKAAAESMDRGRIRGEKYWVDALKIRRGNWGLIPAPLPLGAATGKGADRSSKDFLVSYGLEESPALFRRQAVGRMTTHETITDALVFPHRQNTRLRVSVTVIRSDGTVSASQNTIDDIDTTTLDGALRASQQEVVEQEIFSVLVQEAGNLPTASARVSERLIVIDAAQGMALKFELLGTEISTSESLRGFPDEICDLIYSTLHVLLLCRHGYLKLRRLEGLGVAGTVETPYAPPLLQPTIDLLQYRVFCDRIKFEFDKAVRALSMVGIPSTLRFDPVGETGRLLIQSFSDDNTKAIGGEAVLRIENRHTIRLTFSSPSSLTAHLSQATLLVSSIPQLCQLLIDEIERCLLQRICELGREICEHVGGTWFIDLSQCVGRWEGCVLNFRIIYGQGLTIDCSAFRLDKTTTRQGRLETYSEQAGTVPLLQWVEQIMKKACAV
ncbi:hypothetical protein L208DRAFT_1421005 [Tricholoma matsutake]|nr:hypothetical protein L208DRAFT_1421005 [Tricholoma matsutake 945]